MYWVFAGDVCLGSLADFRHLFERLDGLLGCFADAVADALPFGALSLFFLVRPVELNPDCAHERKAQNGNKGELFHGISPLKKAGFGCSVIYNTLIMNICQYTHKKAFIGAFLIVLCNAFLAHAEPPKEPKILVNEKMEKILEKIINDFNETVDSEIDIALEELKNMEEYKPKKNENATEKKIREKDLLDAINALESARKAIKANARPILVAGCMEITCGTLKIKDMARAYVVKNKAISTFVDYENKMKEFIDQAKRQQAEIKIGYDKLDAGIKAVENPSNPLDWFKSKGLNWFGIEADFYSASIDARTQVDNIDKKIKEINAILAKLQEDLDWLKGGVKRGDLTPQIAENQIAYDKSLILNIRDSVVAIIALMKSKEIDLVIKEKARDMNLPKKIKEAEAILKSIEEMIAFMESDEAERKKQEFLEALAVPVKPFPAQLDPQLIIPPQIKLAPKPSDSSANSPMEDQFVEPSIKPTKPKPNNKPSVSAPVTPPKPTTYFLWWPVLNIFGQPTGDYDLFEYPSSIPRGQATRSNGWRRERLSRRRERSSQAPLQALPTYR